MVNSKEIIIHTRSEVGKTGRSAATGVMGSNIKIYSPNVAFKNSGGQSNMMMNLNVPQMCLSNNNKLRIQKSDHGLNTSSNQTSSNEKGQISFPNL